MRKGGKKKKIPAEDILMGTKSLRHYAAHTGSWISIIAATSSRQSQLPRGLCYVRTGLCRCLLQAAAVERGGSAENLSQPITANVLFMSGYT